MEVKQYTVVWEINGVDATSPEDAAKKALEIQRDPESIALVFRVFGDGEKWCLQSHDNYDSIHTIDLWTNELNGEDLNAD